MQREFKIDRDAYDDGCKIFNRVTHKINSGITFLVGCNGYGKTTFLNSVLEDLTTNDIPFIFHNNLGLETNSFGKLAYRGKMDEAMLHLVSSEGENILNNLYPIFKNFTEFIEEGKNTKDLESERFLKALGDYDESSVKKVETNERWILIDAVDSGLSIDAIIDFKALLSAMVDLAKKKGKDLFIVCTANSYELITGHNCYDAVKAKELTFDNYMDYKKFIIDTRKTKDKRYEKASNKKK